MSKKDEQQPPEIEQQPQPNIAELIQLGIEKALRERDESTQQNGRMGTHVVPRADYEAFFKEPRPDDEFFVLNPHQRLVIQDERRYKNPDTGLEEYTPPLILTFEQYFGPGSDLRKSDGTKMFPRGVGYRRINSTDWPELERAGTIDLEKIKARIAHINAENSATEQILTGGGDLGYAELIKDAWKDRERDTARAEAREQKQLAILTGQAEGHPRFVQ
jgi:hypothetical protein